MNQEHRKPSRIGTTLMAGVLLGVVAYGCSANPGSNDEDCRPASFTPAGLTDPTPTDIPAQPQEPPATSPERLQPLGLSPFDSAVTKMTDKRQREIDGLLSGATIPDIIDHFENDRLSSTDLVTYYLRRIAEFDVGQLNSVIEIDPTAIVQAEEADRARSAGEANGTLLGIPVLLKDNISAGPDTHTTAGAVALSQWRPQRDSTVVANLRRAGAVILGKTNMSEWANFMDDNMPSGFSAVGGQTNNPYGYPTPLGSSSGSAVAASAQFATLTVGTETQGSIISPAGINSAVGFKPSRGLVSRDLIVPLYEPQDTAGPTARNVTDVAVGLTAMAGRDDNDPRSGEACALFDTDFTESLTVDPSVRVGVSVPDDASIEAQLTEASESGVDAETIALIRDNLIAERDRGESIASALERAGATVIRVSDALDPEVGDLLGVLPAGFRRDLDNFLARNPATGRKSLKDIVEFNSADPARRAPYGQTSLQKALAESVTQSAFDDAAEALESNARTSIDALLKKHDIQVYVTTSNAFDQAGYPAVSVPFTYSDEEGPVGVVFSGSHLSDPLLISTAFAFEQATKAWKSPFLP